MSNTVYTFGGGASQQDSRARDKTVVGGKGANLAEMASIGLPVPPGFTISTEVCAFYNEAGKTFDEDIKAGVAAGVAHIEGLRVHARSPAPVGRGEERSISINRPVGRLIRVCPDVGAGRGPGRRAEAHRLQPPPGQLRPAALDQPTKPAGGGAAAGFCIDFYGRCVAE